MLMRFTLAFLVALSLSLQAGAADLAAIKRVIRKEPAYQGAPKYCLLVFGKEATTRIWLVFDGKNYYLDRNGDGDLTEPGEKVVLDANANGFTISQLVKRDGGALSSLRVQAHSDGKFHMIFGQGSNRVQFVGIEEMDRPTWGDKPENAPIIHFDGPMSFERYGPLVSIPRGEGRSRRFSLRLMLGTPGLGKGTFASYDEICSENLGPIQADIVYSHATRIGEMFEQRVELLHDG
jgi:hypothetical protein